MYSQYFCKVHYCMPYLITYSLCYYSSKSQRVNLQSQLVVRACCVFAAWWLSWFDHRAKMMAIFKLDLAKKFWKFSCMSNSHRMCTFFQNRTMTCAGIAPWPKAVCKPLVEGRGANCGWDGNTFAQFGIPPPPIWKKGAYCFATVDPSVCIPSDFRSILFWPLCLIESSQTWYCGCPYREGFQVTWSKVKVKLLV